ncbi:MAG: PRC-barrel domain-containing protein [Mycetocola sp.]
MLDSRDIGGLQGAPVVGRDGDKLGSIGQVFVDATTGAPNWITVKTGLFGHKETFVPLANATWDGERVTVDTDKETLNEAPRIDAGEALSPHNEEALYRYYGMSDTDSDGGTARPDEYPDREYDVSDDGTTVTPVASSAGSQTDAAEHRDLRLSEQPLDSSEPLTAPSTESPHTGEHLGKHARMRRVDPATDTATGSTPDAADPTIDRSHPPRTL